LPRMWGRAIAKRNQTDFSLSPSGGEGRGEGENARAILLFLKFMALGEAICFPGLLRHSPPHPNPLPPWGGGSLAQSIRLDLPCQPHDIADDLRHGLEMFGWHGFVEIDGGVKRTRERRVFDDGHIV